VSAAPLRRAKARLGKPQNFIWPLGILLVALFAAIGVEGLGTWKAYEDTFGAKNASKDWLNRKLTSYSVDTYEELLAIKRLQNYCLQFSLGMMDRDDLNIHRRQVVGAFASFKPGTLIEKEVSRHESFKPAWAAAQRFLDAAKDLEEGRQKIGPVFDVGDEAAAAWGKLAEDAITREFQQRDGMEKAIVEFRPIAVRSFVVISILVALCAMAIAAAGYAARVAWRAERRRFDRFELLLATVGHDLRSPLQALVGAAKLAAADTQPREREKFVGIVHERSAYFTRLLDDLIDLSRSVSLSFVPIHVDLGRWFEVATNRYGQAVTSKGLAFTSALHAEHRAILFDAHRLTQCADNLVSNAIRYTDDGSVDFLVRIVAKAPGEHRLEIVVSDTGRGIDPVDQRRIFEPFVRVEQSDAGLGLGLSMVASLASSLSGTAGVARSAIGEGSTFLFSVPVKLSDNPLEGVPEETEPPTIPQHETVHAGRIVTVPRVLVVDDDPVITEVIGGLLPQMGYDVDLALGGQAGLKMASEQSYCAVITDIQMPGVDGFELAHALRRSSRPCPMLIALTAYTSKKEVAERVDVFDAMLRKPFDELELAELLDQAATRWASAMPA
jgi:signal transduction histidine kinase/CheY-like chemotaxis protein